MKKFNLFLLLFTALNLNCSDTANRPGSSKYIKTSCDNDNLPLLYESNDKLPESQKSYFTVEELSALHNGKLPGTIKGKLRAAISVVIYNINRNDPINLSPNILEPLTLNIKSPKNKYKAMVAYNSLLHYANKLALAEEAQMIPNIVTRKIIFNETLTEFEQRLFVLSPEYISAQQKLLEEERKTLPKIDLSIIKAIRIEEMRQRHEKI